MPLDDTKRSLGRMKERGQLWKKRGDKQFAKRDVFNTLFQAQAEIFYPERADFLGARGDAQERYEGIYSAVPQIMRRDMANLLGAMIRPRGKEWFKAVVRPEALMKDPINRAWLDRATTAQRNVIYSPGANFTRAMSESDNDYVAFGNSVVRHTYNRRGTGLIFACAHLKNCAWAENEEQKVDEMHERMQLTLKQAAGLFGVEGLPKDWKKSLEKHPDRDVEVQRCVAPLDYYTYEKGERPRRAAQFMSLYMACGVKEEEAGLGEGYFDWFPYLVRRWMTVSGEVYGRSPCTSVALADSRTLNVAQQALLKAVEWRVDPPKTAAHDAIVGEINLRAGAITYYDPEALGDNNNRRVIENLEAGEPRFGMELTNQLRLDHGRAFFQNLMKLPEKQMTAYEAGKWIEESIRAGAPVFEPMEEDNAQLMDAVFSRSYAKGAFGRLIHGVPEGMPEALQGAEVKFEFETPLSQAYRELSGQKAAALVADMQAQRQLAPDSMDNVDWDAVTRSRLEDLPAEWARDPELVKQMRESRAEAQMEQAQRDDALAAVDSALKARPENLNKLEQAVAERV